MLLGNSQVEGKGGYNWVFCQTFRQAQNFNGGPLVFILGKDTEHVAGKHVFILKLPVTRILIEV